MTITGPELNPEERLDADLKRAIGSKAPARTKPKLEALTTAHMQKLENRSHVPTPPFVVPDELQ